MRLTVLGSGDASGIPRADCLCAVCQRARAGGIRRGNTCARVEAGGVRLAIDTGAGGDARADALLLTHYHPDHAGRTGEFARTPASSALPAWGPVADATMPEPAVAGVALTTVEPFTSVEIGPVRCTALPLTHPVPAVGWCIEHAGARLAWLTDTYGLPEPTCAWLRAHPCAVVALDTTFPPHTERAPVKQHGDLQTSLAALAACGARRGLLIHVGHGFQEWMDEHAAELPAWVLVAGDGQQLTIAD
jgi:phosphoribosyl 1,2-cyclic phosphate phosphodiesterase